MSEEEEEEVPSRKIIRGTRRVRCMSTLWQQTLKNSIKQASKASHPYQIINEGFFFIEQECNRVKLFLGGMLLPLARTYKCMNWCMCKKYLKRVRLNEYLDVERKYYADQRYSYIHQHTAPKKIRMNTVITNTHTASHTPNGWRTCIESTPSTNNDNKSILLVNYRNYAFLPHVTARR